MDIELTMNRIRNARMAGIYANNELFKTLWHGIADKLEAKLKSYG